jgi:hypothetical protein
MTIYQRIGLLLIATIVGTICFNLGERVPFVRGVVPSAEAVVGRPLTPVSVAGVARRTSRRCAVGVYNC